MSETVVSMTHQWPDPIMNFIIAYDVSDPKRLRRVAKSLESEARRIQKSVFVFTGSRKQLDEMLSGVIQHIEPAEDRIQAWPIRTSNRPQRIDAGMALPELGVAVIVSPQKLVIVEAVDDASESDHPPLILD